MAAPQTTPEINFIGTDELEGRPGGHFVRWALGYGKAVIVLTELVVVLAFISRFALDSRIADLNEIVTKKRDIIVASAPFEKTFRNFSARVGSVEELMKSVTIDRVLADTQVLIPVGIQVDSMTIDIDKIGINGKANSEIDLAQLSNSFKTSERFTKVILERVSRASDKDSVEKIQFSLTGDYLFNLKPNG